MKLKAKEPEDKKQSFYVSLHKKDDRIVSYSISSKPPTHLEEVPPEDKSEETAKVMPDKPAVDFHSVLGAFVSVMDSYLKFASLTLGVAPYLSSLIAERKIADFIKDKGKEMPECSSKVTTIYELDVDCYQEFKLHCNDADAALDGAKQLPEVMVMGLVSAYDAFLSQLLKAVFDKHEEIILTSDKDIKYSELSRFSSIGEVRNALIDREIESIIRASHHEQFAWMERKLSIKLKEELPVWPRFIEIFERRNLLTHTGGFVSAQYLAVGQEQKFDTSNIKMGDKLVVDNKYFMDAVAIIYEVGIKLCYVLWRRFVKDEQEKADSVFNDVCFNLMYHGIYNIAEPLLKFSAGVLKKYKGKEQTRLMMVVNLANAIRLQKREEEAKKIIDQEDLSAASVDLKIGAAAVKGEILKVVELMQQAGSSGPITAQAYRSWPVFRGIKNDKQFIAVFEDIFGEPLISTKAVEVTPTTGNIESDDSKTVH